MRQDQVPDIPLLADQPIEEGEQDILGMAPWAKMLAGVATGTRGPFTIGIHGSWGYGKTSLLGLAKHFIDARKNKFIVTVWFNAWQFEREEHPLFSLIAAIADEIEKKTKAKAGYLTKVGNSLRALTRGMKFNAEVSVPLVGAVGVEFDAEKALQAEEILGKQTNPLQGEMMYHSAFTTLKDEAAKAKEHRIIVFIDDLDRCQPEKAIYLLENIKLILAQPGFIFLMAVDRPVLESYLEQLYLRQCGKDHSDRGKFYLDKIIQLPITIPSHRSRFDGYVEKLIASLAPCHQATAGMLEKVKRIVTAGAGTNPRSLVRLINNFLLDASLWPLIPREGEELQQYQELTANIAAALVINSTLSKLLGEEYRQLIYGPSAQDLCNKIASPEFNPVPRRAAERPGEPEERSDTAILALLAGRSDLVEAIRENGQAWLNDGKLRMAVYEFAQSSRPSAPMEFPEVVAKKIRFALHLEINEPVPSDRLGEVTQLYFRRENVTDEDLRYFVRLTNLQILYLVEKQVTDAGMAHLEELTNLQVLSLYETRVTDAGMAHLEGLTNLQRLFLSETHVSDAGMAHLEGLTNLQELSLGGTQVTDDGLAHLERQTNLQYLNLIKTHVTGTGLAYLKELTNLESLNLVGTQITDAGLAHLKELTNLERLNLAETQVTDAGLAYLEGLTNLRELDLRGTQLTDAGLAYLKALTNLQLLDLSATRVTDAGLTHLEGLTILESLNLVGTQVTDAGLAHLEELTNLRELYLDGTQVTEAGVKKLEGRGVGVEW